MDGSSELMERNSCVKKRIPSSFRGGFAGFLHDAVSMAGRLASGSDDD
jgi:hypothetical protein